MKRFFTVLFLLVALAVSAFTKDEVVQLSAPDKTGGKPLMQALSERHATRDFSDKPISAEILSNLLWATWGINRPDGHRVAPTAKNKQEVIVYVAKNDGVWRYEASSHSLVKVLDKDYRTDFENSTISFVYAAPKGEFDPLHVGALFQNAGLYSASVDLGNVVRQKYIGVLEGKLPLPKGYKIYITQSFGWPKYEPSVTK
ncbi:MAG: nitroreductase family protein [Campylobacteraceae bacterium]|jgi:hypothetical protein|nr:nitroreductase family protein [Campylobacteraceae bacterium]